MVRRPLANQLPSGPLQLQICPWNRRFGCKMRVAAFTRFPMDYPARV